MFHTESKENTIINSLDTSIIFPNQSIDYYTSNTLGWLDAGDYDNRVSG